MATKEETAIESDGSHKRTGTGGIKGQLYEIRLLSWFLLRALDMYEKKTLDSFQLVSNVDGIGAFDDVVIKYTKDGFTYGRILQAKHRESTADNMTIEDLAMGRSRYIDFSIPKYLAEYEVIKEKLSMDDYKLVIFSNASFSVKNEEREFVSRVGVGDDDIMYFPGYEHYYAVRDLHDSNNTVVRYLKKSHEYRGVVSSLAKIVYEDVNDLNMDAQPVVFYTKGIVEHVIEGSGNKWKFRESFLCPEKPYDFQQDFLEASRENYEKKHEDADSLERVIELLKSKEFGAKPMSAKVLEKKISESPKATKDGKVVTFYENLPDYLDVGLICDFLDKYMMFFNMPNQEGLEKMIRDRLLKRFADNSPKEVDLVSNDIFNLLMKRWMKSDYLSEADDAFRTSFDNLNTLKLVELVKLRHERVLNLGIVFRDEIASDLREKIEAHAALVIETGVGLSILSSAKVYQALEMVGSAYLSESAEYRYKYIFMSLDMAATMADEVTETFKKDSIKLVVLEADAEPTDKARRLLRTLGGLLGQGGDKRMVLVTCLETVVEEFLGGVGSATNCHRFSDEASSFADLRPDSQKVLGREWHVIFQGVEISLGDLIEDDEVLKRSVNAFDLVKLMKNEDVVIGRPIVPVESLLI